jgi:hypothetical protein
VAERPVFLPIGEGKALVREVGIEFVWNPGMSASQKKKNVAALHAAAASQNLAPVLEVSTKSDEPLGQRLSAFNLKLNLVGFGECVFESVYQGSKVFERGGPYQDLYTADPRSAKRDPRIRDSGNIVGFQLGDLNFPSEPKTAFYDWLYIRALYPHRDFLKRLERFVGFTDIEFNPERSLNCQARSCARFISLSKRGLLDACYQSAKAFVDVLLSQHGDGPPERDLFQAPQASWESSASVNLPLLSHAAATGDRGRRIVDEIVHDELDWVFRETTRHDFGIDGHIEVIDENRKATGRILAVQIKCGESFFKETSADGVVYRGEQEHLNYWLQLSLPVVLILCDPKSRKAYWTPITLANIERTKDGWKTVVPFLNRLALSCKNHLEEIVRPIQFRDILPLALYRLVREKFPDLLIAQDAEVPRDFAGFEFLAKRGQDLLLITYCYEPLDAFRTEHVERILACRDQCVRHCGWSEESPPKVVVFFLGHTQEALKLGDDVVGTLQRAEGLSWYRLQCSFDFGVSLYELTDDNQFADIYETAPALVQARRA